MEALYLLPGSWIKKVHFGYNQCMFIKKYTYQLLPGKMEEFLELQKDANALYREYTNVKIECLESDRTPGRIVEIEYFASKEEYEKASKAREGDRRCVALQERFKKLLDKEDVYTEAEDYEILDTGA